MHARTVLCQCVRRYASSFSFFLEPLMQIYWGHSVVKMINNDSAWSWIKMWKHASKLMRLTGSKHAYCVWERDSVCMGMCGACMCTRACICVCVCVWLCVCACVKVNLCTCTCTTVCVWWLLKSYWQTLTTCETLGCVTISRPKWSRIWLGVEPPLLVPPGQRWQRSVRLRICIHTVYCVVLFCCNLNKFLGQMAILLANQ